MVPKTEGMTPINAREALIEISNKIEMHGAHIYGILYRDCSFRNPPSNPHLHRPTRHTPDIFQCLHPRTRALGVVAIA